MNFVNFHPSCGMVYEIGKELCSPEKIVIKRIPEYAMLHYVFGGKGFVNGECVKEGMGFFVPMGQYVEYLPDAENPWQYVWIDFGAEVYDISKYGLGEHIRIFEMEKVSDIVQLIDLTLQMIPENPDKSALFDGAFHMVLSYHSTKETQTEILVYSERERHVKDAVLYLQNYYYEDITMEKLAVKLYISRAYLRNLFMEQLHISPQGYLIQIRIEKAKQLLCTTEYTVSQIAAAVGYHDPLQFSRMFKKRVGGSPLHYRESSKLLLSRID